MLDLLRFLACVAVVFWHYQHFFYTSPGVRVSGFTTSSQPFYCIFSLFYRYGLYSVHLFWMLSGFVFFALFAEKIFSKDISAKTFFVDRFSRLYPLHLLTLLLVAFLVWLVKSATGNFGIYPHNDLRNFILNLFLVPYVLKCDFSFNGPIWSMTLEWIAYTLFFLYVRFLKADIIKTFALIAVFCFPLIFHILPWLNPAVLKCCIYFFSGGALFLLLNKLSKRISIYYIYLFFSVILIVGFLLCHKLILICLLLILIFSYPVKLPAKTASFFLFLGNTTYSIYLLHVPLQLSMIYFYKKALHSNLYEHAQSPVVFIVFAALLFGLSVLSYYCFEYPAKKYLRRVLLGSRNPSTVARQK